MSKILCDESLLQLCFASATLTLIEGEFCITSLLTEEKWVEMRGLLCNARFGFPNDPLPTEYSRRANAARAPDANLNLARLNAEC